MAVCLYFVVPCYNDEETLKLSVPVFLNKLEALTAAGTIAPSSRLLLVNDGSGDNTWETMLRLKEEYQRITAVCLAENVGEQNALLAGMFTAAERADCVITMDSDLQDDIDTVDEMLQRYEEGCEIVYGVHKVRKQDSFTERFFAGGFYSLMRLARTGLIYQHANFRLMSRHAIALLKEQRQTWYLLPCVVSNMPLKSAIVYHDRLERVAGHSKYNFKSKFQLAVNALLAHSSLPVTALGAAALLCATAGIAFTAGHLSGGTVSVGWCILCAVLLAIATVCGGLCLWAAKKRKSFLKPIEAPRYTIREVIE